VSEPLVSVVVSTYNRPVRLQRLLAALGGQRLSRESFEVIVVDNGSDPATGELIATASACPGLQLRSVRHAETLGPAGGRNSGWRIARAPLIAFVDDDCAPDPDWLTAGLRAHARDPAAVLQGRTVPDPSDLENDGPLSRTVRVESLGPQYEACNIFYPRELLDSLGGFDERFGVLPAGEDTDLAWRAIEAGARIMFAPDAVVFHAIERLGILGMLRFASRWGAGLKIFHDHPQTRTMLYRGIFWNVWHFLLWRSLIALVAPRALRRLILFRHLHALHERAAESGAGPWFIAFLLAHDTVECWSVARGAVRNRTLVL
jgi:GT2 family glycosyltransferase